MQSRYTDIVDAVHLRAIGLCDDGGFLSDRQIGGACADHPHEPGGAHPAGDAGGPEHEEARKLVVFGAGKGGQRSRRSRGRDARCEHGCICDLEETRRDGDHLLGRLALGVDRFRQSLSELPMCVEAREGKLVNR